MSADDSMPSAAQVEAAEGGRLISGSRVLAGGSLAGGHGGLADDGAQLLVALLVPGGPVRLPDW